MIAPRPIRLHRPAPRRCRVGHKDAKGKGYSIFRSAAEEAEMRGRDARQRAGEGGHMSCTRGRIVSSPGTGMPFTAVMTRDDGSTFDVAFATMAVPKRSYGVTRPVRQLDRRRTTTIAISASVARPLTELPPIVMCFEGRAVASRSIRLSL